MNIFFDARWTRLATHDGVSRYGASLVEALVKLHPVTMIICDKRQLKLLPRGVPYVQLNNPISLRELFIARKLNKLGADVVFSPLQIMGSWGRRYKLILTLQDLIYYSYAQPPASLPLIARAVWWLFHRAYWPQRLVLSLADHVTTVSQTSKQEILAHRLTNRPVSVVSNAAVALPRIEPVVAPKKELVFMGSFMRYKNVELLLGALPLLPGYTLHLISPISADRRAELERLIDDSASVVFWNGMSDLEYARLLSTATALVSASKAEGFGLPLLEAMHAGAPVVCSDLPIFHEVGGDAAIYFDPDSPEDFARAVKRATAEREARITRGYEQAAHLTWERSAAELLKIMEGLVRYNKTNHDQKTSPATKTDRQPPCAL